MRGAEGDLALAIAPDDRGSQSAEVEMFAVPISPPRQCATCRRGGPAPSWRGRCQQPWQAIEDDFITRVEADALAVLRPLDTTRKCLEFARSYPPSDGYLGPRWFLIAAIALGEIDEAQAKWAQMGGYYRRGIPGEFDHAPTFHRYRILDEPLLAGDRAALAAILNGRAAENVKGSPLEPYWEPAPLPIEAPA